MSLPLASTADLPSADMVRLAHREPPSAGFALPLQIVGWRESNAPKLGFFDVELGGYGLVILNVAAFCLDDQIWVILPRYRQIGAAGRPVLDKHGRKQWRRPLSFRPGTQSAFVKALVGAIRAYRPGLIPDTARPGPLPAWSGSDES